MTEARSMRLRPYGVVLAVCLFLATFAVWRGETSYIKYLVAILGGTLAAAVAAADARGASGLLRPGRFFALAVVAGLGLPVVTMLFGGVGTYTMAQFLWMVLALLVGWLAPRQGLLRLASGWPGAMAWAAGGVAVLGLLQVLGFLPGGFNSYGEFDAPSVFGLSNFAIEFVVPLVPLIWPDARVTGRARWVRYGLVILTVAYALASGSRAAILGLGVACVVWGMLVTGARVQMAAGAMVVAAVSAMVLLRPGGSDAFRLEAWLSAGRVWLDNPLGVGLGWFADAVQSYLTPEALARQMRTMHRVGDPHNELIRLLVELGPVGAALIFGLVVHMLQRQDRWRNDPGLSAGVAAWVAIAMVAFPGHTVSGALSAGLLLAQWRELGAQMGSAPAQALRALKRTQIALLAVALAVTALPAWQLTRSAQAVHKAQNYMRRKVPLPANAVGYYRDAVRAAPYDRSAQLGLMTTGYVLKDYVVTVKAAENFLDARFVPPDALIQAMVAAVESRNGKQAELWHRQHQTMIESLALVDRMALALTLQSGRQYVAAAELLSAEDVLATVDGRLMLAQVYFDQRKYTEALALIDAGLALPSATMGLKLARALALEHLEQLDDAQAYLEQLVAERPQFAQTYLYLARLSWLRRDDETAWKYVSTAFGYDRNLKIEPNEEDDPVFRDLYQYVAKRLTIEKMGAAPASQAKGSQKK